MKKSNLYTPESEKDKMLNGLKTGKIKGTSTYIDILDPAWTWRNGEVTLVTGMANEGKSEILKQICLIKSLEENKKFVFYSPEDFPPEEFYDGMIHTLSGMSTDKDNENFISEELYIHCLNLIKDKFIFLHIPPPYNTYEAIIETVKEIMEVNDIYSLIIDPHIKVSRSRISPERDDLNGAYIMDLLCNFTREYNIITFLVMHQLTPRINDNGLYPKPSGYQIKQGGSYYDTTDNCLFMWRPEYAKDKLNPKCVFGSLKIKKQKLTGVPQDIEISFDRKSNRYCYKDSIEPLYNWDKWLPNYKKVRTF